MFVDVFPGTHRVTGISTLFRLCSRLNEQAAKVGKVGWLIDGQRSPQKVDMHHFERMLVVFQKSYHGELNSPELN